jgi:acyl carrier protein
MNQEQIYLTLGQIIARNTTRGGGPDRLEADTELDQFGIDSAHRIDILLDTEDEFHISIAEAAFAKVRTAGDLAKLVSDSLAIAA